MQDAITNLYDAMRRVEAETKFILPEETTTLKERNETLTAVLSEKDKEISLLTVQVSDLKATLGFRHKTSTVIRERYEKSLLDKHKEIRGLEDEIDDMKMSRAFDTEASMAQHRDDMASLAKKEDELRQVHIEKLKLDKELQTANKKIKNLAGKALITQSSRTRRSSSVKGGSSASANKYSEVDAEHSSNKRKRTDNKIPAFPDDLNLAIPTRQSTPETGLHTASPDYNQNQVVQSPAYSATFSQSPHWHAPSTPHFSQNPSAVPQGSPHNAFSIASPSFSPYQASLGPTFPSLLSN